MLEDALNERMTYPSTINMRHAPEIIAVQAEVPEGVYTILFPERRIYTPTTEVFIGWMIGSSILLSAIAFLFMRNQIRPIRRLAVAAEAIGTGREVPWFKPEGATEVRQAAAALQIMHDRLRRQITQRTAMLAGVSARSSHTAYAHEAATGVDARVARKAGLFVRYRRHGAHG